MKKIVLYLNILVLSSCKDGESTNYHVTETDLRGKKFDVVFEIDSSDSKEGLEWQKGSRVQFVFHQDTTFVMRFTVGSKMTQKTYTWRFIGDSLQVGGFQTASEMSSIERESNGEYLIKAGKSQILLMESK